MEEQILKILLKDWRYPVQKSSKDITAHVFEFIRWCFQECPFVIGENANRKVIAMSVKYGNQYTLEELYKYWLNNVKDK